ncbi:MAG: BatD family protein [Candidatus Omnitrophica bacterium]|nr:BatD family protein [Candidatus Omnitrophota bacterium]
MKLKFFLTLFISLFIIHPAFAQDTIKAEINKNKLSTDEVLIYKLVIASSQTQFPQAQLPKFDGFNILSQSQSTTLALENNGWKTSLIYEFILAPLTVGTLKIDPASIKIKGQTFSSDPFEVEVTQGKLMPRAPGKNPSLPDKSLPESEEPKITL